MTKHDFVSNTNLDVCSACGGIFTVTKKGKIRHHLGDELEPNGIWRKRCDGAGKPPKP